MKRFFISALSLCLTLNSLSAKLSIKEMIVNRKPPQWMVDSINEQFSLYQRSGITEAMINKRIEQNTPQLLEYVIKNNRVDYNYINIGPNQHWLVVSRERNNVILKALKLLAREVKLPDVRFIISIQDGYVGEVHNTSLVAPLFCFAKKKTEQTGVLFPDFENIVGFYPWRQTTIDASQKHLWESKLNKAIWRGGLCGEDEYVENGCYESFPRMKAVRLSIERPDLIDARFTQSGAGLYKNFEENESLYLSSKIPISEQIKYKYQILVDGVTCAYSRTFWQLLSNCLVLKQESENCQWYYPGLKANVHYIPLKEDISDLAEKIQWAKSHDAECKRIAAAGTRFANEWLGREECLFYVYHLLIKYAKLQKF